MEKQNKNTLSYQKVLISGKRYVHANPKKSTTQLKNRPLRSARKSSLPVELLLHADCLDAKQIILLKAEPTEDSGAAQVTLQEFEDRCNESVASLQDPEDENEIVHAQNISASFFASFSSRYVIQDALPTKCEIKFLTFPILKNKKIPCKRYFNSVF